MTSKSRFKKIRHSIEPNLDQANNFVIDLNNKDCDLTNNGAILQINKVFKDFEKVQKIVLIGKSEQIYYFIKK